MSQTVLYKIGKGIGITGTLALVIWGMVQCQISENRQKAERTKANNDNLQKNLPDGCTFKYVGVYDRGQFADIPVTIVRCDGRTTETSSTLRPEGKFQKPNSTTVIEEQR